MRSIATLVLLILALTTPALASDGVLEINQVCATQIGCFSGDTAGFPVTIDGSAGRSYRLSSDLVLPNENTSGILVSTPDVGIDLNDFAILRAACVGATTNCTPTSGSGSGIRVSIHTLVRGVSVRNGAIVGMGSNGVDLGEQARVSGLRVRWNRAVGISAGFNSTLSDNIAFQNGDSGIFGSTNSRITENIANGNGGRGIFGAFGSTVSNNTANGNGGPGIETFANSSVRGNTVAFNTGFGLVLAASVYRENVITNNTAGTVSGSGVVNMGDNSCNGTTTCP